MDDINVKYSEIKTWDKESYVLVDMRDDSSIGYGMIPGAIHIPEEKIDEKIDDVSAGKKVVIYCTRGVFSADVRGNSENRKILKPTVLRADIQDGYLKISGLKKKKRRMAAGKMI